MSFPPCELYRMIEVRTRDSHCCRTYDLPDHQRCQPEPQKEVVPGFRPKRESVVWKESIPEHTLQQRTRMRRIVCPPVDGKKERGDVCFQGIVPRRTPELEEVEEREDGEEEGNPPEMRRLIEKIDAVHD